MTPWKRSRLKLNWKEKMQHTVFAQYLMECLWMWTKAALPLHDMHCVKKICWAGTRNDMFILPSFFFFWFLFIKHWLISFLLVRAGFNPLSLVSIQDIFSLQLFGTSQLEFTLIYNYYCLLLTYKNDTTTNTNIPCTNGVSNFGSITWLVGWKHHGYK